MGKRRLLIVFLAAVSAAAFVSSEALGASFIEAITGIGYDSSPRGGRILQPSETPSNLDWPVYILVRVNGVVNGTQMSATRINPAGETLWTGTIRWGGNAPLGWGTFFMPFPGTPMEDMVGQWKIVLALDGVQVKDLPMTLKPADRSILDVLKAEASRNPNSFTANYRLGVAASMFADDQLATTHLKKAVDLARGSIYPHLALGRHYLRRGMKKDAFEEFVFTRGLLLGEVDTGFVEWLRKLLEDYVRQTE